jgi:hypothetical protein
MCTLLDSSARVSDLASLRVSGLGPDYFTAPASVEWRQDVNRVGYRERINMSFHGRPAEAAKLSQACVVYKAATLTHQQLEEFHESRAIADTE